MSIHRSKKPIAIYAVWAFTVSGAFIAPALRADDVPPAKSEKKPPQENSLLLRRGFESFLRDTSATLFQGVTPLMHAARANNTKHLQGLIAIGVDVDETSKYGWTALMFAAWKGHEKAVDLLLDAGADPNVVSKRIAVATTAPTPRTTALRQALLNGHVSIANTLLDRGASIDAESMVLAGGAGDVVLLKRLHDKDANVNQVSGVMYYSSPLCMAAKNGKLDAVKWLIKNGADPHLKARGTTALGEAVAGDHAEIVEYLFLHAIDPDLVSRDEKGAALFKAATKRTKPENYAQNLQIIATLLSHGADKAYRSKFPYHQGKSVLEFVQGERAETAGRIKPNMNKTNRARIEGVVKHQDAIINLLEKYPESQ